MSLLNESLSDIENERYTGACTRIRVPINLRSSRWAATLRISSLEGKSFTLSAVSLGSTGIIMVTISSCAFFSFKQYALPTDAEASRASHSKSSAVTARCKLLNTPAARAFKLSILSISAPPSAGNGLSQAVINGIFFDKTRKVCAATFPTAPPPV